MKKKKEIYEFSEKEMKHVINRLYNCKFKSAYKELKKIKYIPQEILDEFYIVAIDFGNCGWGGRLISETAERLANLIEYEWNDKKDYYTKILILDKNG